MRHDSFASTGEVDPCAGSESPAIELGIGFGWDFHPYRDGDRVDFVAGVKGGFGFPYSLRTTGVPADTFQEVTVESELRHGREIVGFYREAATLLCADDGGRLVGFLAPFWPELGSEDLEELNGELVTVEVILISADDSEVSGTVVLEVGWGLFP